MINLFILTLGASLFLSTVGVFFRDMEYLWNIALTLIMYTCAIFYKVDRFDTKGGGAFAMFILKVNPLYCIITNFRQSLGLLFENDSSMVLQAFNWNYALYSFVFGAVLLLIGSLLFAKKQDKFILYI